MTCQWWERPDSDGAQQDTRRRTNVEPEENQRITEAMKELNNTGWYWGALTANEAKDVLSNFSEGSFLIRDSSQRDFLFTISAMTSAGPTNLRIEFKHGKFKLDSVVLVKPKLKQFNSVVHLVEHYVQLSKNTSTNAQASSSSSSSSSTSSSSSSQFVTNGTVQLLLTKPVYARTPTLQHLCRINIHRLTKNTQSLPLPNRLKDYLAEYKYNV